MRRASALDYGRFLFEPRLWGVFADGRHIGGTTTPYRAAGRALPHAESGRALLQAQIPTAVEVIPEPEALTAIAALGPPADDIHLSAAREHVVLIGGIDVAFRSSQQPLERPKQSAARNRNHERFTTLRTGPKLVHDRFPGMQFPSHVSR